MRYSFGSENTFPGTFEFESRYGLMRQSKDVDSMQPQVIMSATDSSVIMSATDPTVSGGTDVSMSLDQNHMDKEFNVAICGATGNVGRKMLEVLNERNFPIKNLSLLASKRSVGETIEYKGVQVPVTLAEPDAFKGVDIALFSAGGDVSAELAPKAAENGAVVIDNSSHWRMHENIPLVVPEVNPKDIGLYKDSGIIANPNCSTIQMVVALMPLHLK